MPLHRPAPPASKPAPARHRLVLIGSLTLGCGAALPVTDSAYFVNPAAANSDCAPMVTQIEHVDEPTPLGFTAVDVLTRVAGPSEAPLFWLEPAENQEYLLTLGPEHGRSSVALEVRLQDGPILHRYSVPAWDAPEDTTCDAGVLQIPVRVTLDSAAQGLTESFDSVLEASVPYRGHLRKSFESGALRGSLGLAHVASLDPERSFWLGPVTLEADLWPGGSAGSLSVSIDAKHAKASKVLRDPPLLPSQPGRIAAWPSLALCEGTALTLPTDAKVLGFSVDDVLASLRDGGPRSLTWSDGSVSQVQLALDSQAPELCQEVGESLSFDVMLRARSEDGGLDVSLPVHVAALDAGGTLGAISIASAAPEAPYPVARGADGAGSSLDAEGYKAILVALEWSHAGDRDSGSLSLRGVEARTPDADGIYPSTVISSARWSSSR